MVGTDRPKPSSVQALIINAACSLAVIPSLAQRICALHCPALLTRRPLQLVLRAMTPAAASSTRRRGRDVAKRRPVHLQCVWPGHPWVQEARDARLLRSETSARAPLSVALALPNARQLCIAYDKAYQLVTASCGDKCTCSKSSL